MKLSFGLHIELAGKPVPAPLWSLLHALEREGSLAAAARSCGFSYRRAWEMLRTAERLYGHPLAVLERGRGARPSELCNRLLAAHSEAHKQTTRVLERIAKSATHALARAPTPVAGRLRICASHDLAMVELKRFCAQAAPALAVDLQFHGSLDALDALARGRCDVAGFHIHSETVVEGAFRSLLEHRQMRVIVFAARRQGLMVAPANPKAIRSLSDLARKRVRFINRQSGSGTRLLLDQLLATARVEPSLIRGFDQEEYTHLAVAATIASGHADAGVGIEAAAARYGLTFIALATETYYLAVRGAQLEREPIRSFLGHLSSRPLRRRIGRLPGYDVRPMGQRVPIEAMLAQSSERRARVDSTAADPRHLR